MKEELNQAAKIIEGACGEARKLLEPLGDGDGPFFHSVRKICVRLAPQTAADGTLAPPEASAALLRIRALVKSIDEKAVADAAKRTAAADLEKAVATAAGSTE
jgi:hypothetical protein